MTTRPQTFIEPVSDVVEQLSAAGRYADDLSTRGRQVTIEVHYLHLEVVARSGQREVRRGVGWLEVSESRGDVVRAAIDTALEELR